MKSLRNVFDYYDKETIPLQVASWRTTIEAIWVSFHAAYSEEDVSSDSNFTARWLRGETTVIYFYTSYFI